MRFGSATYFYQWRYGFGDRRRANYTSSSRYTYTSTSYYPLLIFLSSFSFLYSWRELSLNPTVFSRGDKKLPFFPTDD